jgi:hypothetical protein
VERDSVLSKEYLDAHSYFPGVLPPLQSGVDPFSADNYAKPTHLQCIHASCLLGELLKVAMEDRLDKHVLKGRKLPVTRASMRTPITLHYVKVYFSTVAKDVLPIDCKRV